MTNEIELFIGEVAGSIRLGTISSGTGPFEPLELDEGAVGIRFDRDDLT